MVGPLLRVTSRRGNREYQKENDTKNVYDTVHFSLLSFHWLSFSLF